MKRSQFEQEDIIDSRDIIERLEELREEKRLHESTDKEEKLLSVWDDDFAEELEALEEFESEASNTPDWEYGEQCIREEYFTEYIEDLINDCYELPKEINSGDWPWRHMEINFEGAAEEAKQDYFYVSLFGSDYYIRA